MVDPVRRPDQLGAVGVDGRRRGDADAARQRAEVVLQVVGRRVPGSLLGSGDGLVELVEAGLRDRLRHRQALPVGGGDLLRRGRGLGAELADEVLGVLGLLLERLLLLLQLRGGLLGRRARRRRPAASALSACGDVGVDLVDELRAAVHDVGEVGGAAQQVGHRRTREQVREQAVVRLVAEAQVDGEQLLVRLGVAAGHGGVGLLGGLAAAGVGVALLGGGQLRERLGDRLLVGGRRGRGATAARSVPPAARWSGC